MGSSRPMFSLANRATGNSGVLQLFLNSLADQRPLRSDVDDGRGLEPFGLVSVWEEHGDTMRIDAGDQREGRSQVDPNVHR